MTTRAYKWICIILLGLVFPLAIAPLTNTTLAQEKTLVWDRFDVEITVNTDGSFDVAEHQRINFTSGSFTNGYRDIPKQNFGSIDGWALTDSSGNFYTPSNSGDPYTFSVEENYSNYVVRWYFPQLRNASETYTLSYRVHDGLRYYEGGDQLWWKAIYGDRSFPVLDGEVMVTVPDAAEIHEWAAYINSRDAIDSATAEVIDNGHTIVYDVLRQLGSGQEFEVRVEFTPDVVDGTVQPWQAEADRIVAEQERLAAARPIANILFGVVGLLFLLGGPALLYALWYVRGRDKPVELVADYLPEPPDELPPGMAGTLLDESVDMQDIIATLVDLARRKAISITEDKKKNWLTSGTDFVYRRERNDVPLNAYEQELIDALFSRKKSVRLSNLKEKFYKDIPGIKTAMYDEVVKTGYFPSSPESTRSRYGCLGVAGLVVSGVFGFLLLGAFSDLTGLAIFPAIGMGATALGMLMMSRHMPRKTDEGSEAAARWRAFKSYLQNIEKYSDLEAQKEIWDRWLPYAIAFGIDKQYMRKFESVDAPAPGWYIPTPTMYGPYRRGYYGGPWVGPRTGTGSGGERPVFNTGDVGDGLGDMSRGMGGGLTAMSAGLGTMLTSASSTMTSRPASSSSSGGWSSGGGGFSGGGFSGGGGGGGGGGGFS